LIKYHLKFVSLYYKVITMPISMKKTAGANTPATDELYNIENYDDAEIFDVLGLPEDFDRDAQDNDQLLANAILKQIQKFSNISPDGSSDEAKKMAKFFLDIYEFFFPEKTVADTVEDAYDDQNPNTLDDIASTYTDAELYELLGLDNPSDQLLEAKLSLLISQYSKYKNSDNQSEGKQLYNLYKNIYAHFFLPTDSTEDPPVKNPPKVEWAQNETRSLDDLNNEIQLLREKNKQLSNQLAATPFNPTAQPSKISESVVGYTQPLEYSRGVLNPILKQTITRVISIDSQYRSDKTKIPTEFTFNLSEPLRDVVSLRLYSVQIPYTWYTIGTAYGNNFFYIKGRASGIDNGNHDIKIEIPPGNYKPSELISRVNTAIQDIASSNIDTNLGSTAIVYNENTSLCKINVDTSKSYNESSFSLSFNAWTTPYLEDVSRNNSIPAYLGLDRPTYYSNTLLSPPVFEDIALNTDNSELFYVSDQNNYLSVLLSDDISFNITLSLAVDASYSRLAIANDMNTQLSSSSYLVDSFVSRKNINADANITSYFEMRIKPNRFATSITQDTQTRVIFPETTPNLWTGGSSCFRFDASDNVLNRIISDIPTILVSEEYNVNDDASIEINCILNGYDVDENKITISIPNNDKYTSSQFVNAINTNIGTINTSNNNYLSGSEARFENETFQFDVGINKVYDQTFFKLDLSGSILNTIYDISSNGLPVIDNIGSSYPISLPLDIQTKSYTISPGDKIASIILTENSDISYNVFFPNTLIDYLPDEIAGFINTAFDQYVDPESGLHIFQGFKFSPFSSGISKLTTSIQKKLVPANFSIQFKTDNLQISSWSNNWFIDERMITDPYNLSSITSSTIDIITVSAIQSLTPGNPIIILPGINDTIRINAIDDGVSSTNNANSVEIVIDPNTYSRSGLITEINAKIQATAATSITDITGTSFAIESLTRSGDDEPSDYLVITFRAKRAYTPSDYNLVFYDNISFTTCFTGASSVRNTTWDTTIGWIMGFRKYISYDLSATFENDTTVVKTTDSTGKITIYGDTGVSTNLYNYFLICLDDYNQNRLNDGLVTITNVDTTIPLPSYASRSEFVCDPITGNRIFNSSNQNQTAAQIFSANVASNSTNQATSIGSSVLASSYGTGPFVSDVFGLIPIKTSGLLNGSAYVEFGGTLQNQERSYFGPVNINRMTVRLVNDRGDVVDLNNANWSFSLICEQLNKLNPGSK